MSSGQRRRNRRSTKGPWYAYAIVGAAIVAIVVVGFLAFTTRSASQTGSRSTVTTASSTSESQSTKPIILYVNQGNGVVNQSNFAVLVSVSISHGFNTLFFQIYREGTLLFTTEELSSFVTEAHEAGLKIFFSLYFTNSSQQIPASIYPLGEDGISLDMSGLTISSQQALYSLLDAGYSGTKAITTDDMTLPITPNLLILETYGSQYQQFIRPGIIASVEVVATSSKADYEQQVQYALNNSDGVMVFDYAGLVKSGY